MSTPFPYPYTEQRLPAPARPQREQRRMTRGRSPTSKPIPNREKAFATYAIALDTSSRASSTSDFLVINPRTSSASDTASMREWQHIRGQSANSSGDSVPAPRAILSPRAEPASSTGDSVPGSSLILVERAQELEISSDEEITIADVAKKCEICDSLYSRKGSYCSYSCQTRAIVQGLPGARSSLRNQAYDTPLL